MNLISWVCLKVTFFRLWFYSFSCIHRLNLFLRRWFIFTFEIILFERLVNYSNWYSYAQQEWSVIKLRAIQQGEQAGSWYPSSLVFLSFIYYYVIIVPFNIVVIFINIFLFIHDSYYCFFFFFFFKDLLNFFFFGK